jgi:hypothetical protein
LWHPAPKARIYNYMPSLLKTVLSLAIAALALGLSSCSPPGSGGGGGDDFDPLRGADVYLSVGPDRIGVGERTLVRVDVQRINPDGVLVVLRFPSESLAYVSNSTRFTVGANTVAINPTYGPIVRLRRTYITYFLPYEPFDGENAGYVELQLRGERREDGALIELDQFLHNPLIAPEREFDVDDPDFSADDAERIDIVN